MVVHLWCDFPGSTEVRRARDRDRENAGKQVLYVGRTFTGNRPCHRSPERSTSARSRLNPAVRREAC